MEKKTSLFYLIDLKSSYKTRRHSTQFHEIKGITKSYLCIQESKDSDTS